MAKEGTPEKVVQKFRRKTRRLFSAEEKIRLCSKVCAAKKATPRCAGKKGLPNLYYRWSKEFLEAGKKRLVGDTSREATAEAVRGG